ncbi:hypothetical protein B9Q01_07585 [Candidatus Marsarchaeota G1 archaeon OSP_D]|jgi:hypothetical protein|uniref:DUF3311 domain-containing protein n=4 Tax=Candidatus Marsarchaeota TaxID=1978152 RepID=A0A2R6C2M7_9ARCH|nr:MAG: hypothetical protein B9Q01_07585 [Candidatus Marsarchaeota G1 archaeon OSP_D]PSN84700.1 MAG: hypothetical protein B9Q02_09125 [Candidatus Marsarchaeota G1 archaeon BE_D]PSN87617.1 MAG: hypothetical protein B9Q00_08350 [Candidatus Marsarchaeota G1 archaeon OSP_C]PSO05142.1 MAG: hypothetical protein B9Q12_01065 [Candidatus Marsarchaeota G2 archaeon ECH_B_SAG-G06]
MKGRHVAALILLLIGIVANLLTPLYNTSKPMLGGLPFFYWSQTLVLFLVTFVYLGFSYIMREDEQPTSTQNKGEQK